MQVGFDRETRMLVTDGDEMMQEIVKEAVCRMTAHCDENGCIITISDDTLRVVKIKCIEVATELLDKCQAMAMLPVS